MLANVVAASSPDPRIEHQVVEMISGGDCAQRIRANGIPVHSLGMTRGHASVSALLRFAHLLRQVRPHIVQTWLYHADLLGLAALPLLGVPVVWNIRSAWHQGIGTSTPRLCARLSQFPAAVIVNSEAGRRVHENIGYRPRRWCLIRNGFDLESFKPDRSARASVRQELGLSVDALLVGLVGRWDPHKDHSTFFRAAGRLSRQYPNAHCVLIGEGVSPQNPHLSALVSESGLAGRVHLLGRRDDIPRLTAALDVASCTSNAEGFPNVVGEAMASGVPCVATDVGDAAMLVDDAQMIVPPRDPEALAAAWARLVSMSPEARVQLGLKARERVGRKYSLQTVVSQYESLYMELAGNSGAGRFVRPWF